MKNKVKSMLPNGKSSNSGNGKYRTNGVNGEDFVLDKRIQRRINSDVFALDLLSDGFFR